MRLGGHIGEHEELAPAMRPAGHLGDRPRRTVGRIELVEPRISCPQPSSGCKDAWKIPTFHLPPSTFGGGAAPLVFPSTHKPNIAIEALIQASIAATADRAGRGLPGPDKTGSEVLSSLSQGRCCAEECLQCKRRQHRAPVVHWATESGGRPTRQILQ